MAGGAALSEERDAVANITYRKYIFVVKIAIMDSKITLSFDKQIIEKAKEYAASQNLSLSRLTEYLLRQVMQQQQHKVEEYPIAAWVAQVAEGEVEYITKHKSSRTLKDDFYESKK
jgi:predicted aspartyl protease